MADAPTLSLREAAERLDVHYMTVYRYVRLGMLPARKEGAAWVVDTADVDEFASPPATPQPGRRSADWGARLRARLVAGDERGSWGVVEAALASGLTPVDVYEDVLQPVMTDIGDAWALGHLDVADEHRASAVAARIVGRLGPRFARRGRSRGTVVTATPAGDLHGLGLAVVADLLRGARFEVVDLGPNTPPESLARAVAEANRLVAVAISAHNPDGGDDVLAAVAASRRAAGGALVVVGGPAIDGPDHAAALGADGYAPSGRAAVALVEDLVSQPATA